MPAMSPRTQQLQAGMSAGPDQGPALFEQGFLDYRFEHPERLTMPVLVVAGTKDFQAMIEPVKALVAKLPNARLVEYEGLGHFMFVEDPASFARDVSAYLQTP
jgi:proline iminopeptidase